MAWWSFLTGNSAESLGKGVETASRGVATVVGSVGSLTQDIASAFTGEITAEDKAKLLGQAQKAESQAREAQVELAKAQTAVITAEAKGESWLQRNWRPLTMLSFVFIIVNNYILYPYITLFGGQAVALEIPPDMWKLLTIGIGGYTAFRSIEKTTESITGVKKLNK